MNIATQIHQQRKSLEEAVSYALGLANKHAEQVEVSIIKTTGLSISTRFGEVENVERNSDGVLNITVYSNQCKGSASSTDLHSTSIEKVVQAALDIAKFASPDPFSGLPESQLLAFESPDLDLFHPKDIDIKHAIQLAAEAEKVALGSNALITNTEGSSFNSYNGVKVFGNSLGMLQSYCFSRYSMSCSVIAEQNSKMERDYAYTVARNFDRLQTAHWVGSECAKRTIARLNPRRLKTQQVPVIFSAEVATGLFKHLVAAISGGNLYRKSSFLTDHLGKVILPDWLTIDEQPHVLQGIASAPFDGEGVRTQPRKIVEKGVLQSYLLSNYSAKKLGMQSTGHASGIHNWQVSGSNKTWRDLVRQMHKGLIVTELMGQGVNTVTGDYSRGAAGFWVEGGEIQYPVSEITIAGNLREMWRNIQAIGDDIETRSDIQCGSILIPALSIAGE